MFQNVFSPLRIEHHDNQVILLLFPAIKSMLFSLTAKRGAASATRVWKLLSKASAVQVMFLCADAALGGSKGWLCPWAAVYPSGDSMGSSVPLWEWQEVTVQTLPPTTPQNVDRVVVFW